MRSDAGSAYNDAQNVLTLDKDSEKYVSGCLKLEQ